MQAEVVWNCEAGGPLSFAAMRSAVAAFLFARSHGMRLIVRTGAGASAEASAKLRRELSFLGIRPEGFFPLSSREKDGCCAAAAHLITSGSAYCSKRRSLRRILFRLPETARLKSILVKSGPKSVTLHSGITAEISRNGIVWRSPEGVRRCSLAAMPDLILHHTDGHILFRGAEQREELTFGKRFVFRDVSLAMFSGQSVRFLDTDSKEHLHPLEQLADPVLVDGSGQPTPLLTGVLGCIELGNAVQTAESLSEAEAAAQVLIFDAFGYPPPKFLLPLPAEPGKFPDFTELRRLGIVPEVLFHELARLAGGFAPAGQVLPQAEWIRLFRHPDEHFEFQHFDQKHLRRLNRNFLQTLPSEEFRKRVRSRVPAAVAADPRFPLLADEMQSETEVLSDAAKWKY